ncbi:hypothetical protein D3C77_504020 [compost metagenome]
MLDISFNRGEVIEAFEALGMLRRFACRKLGVKFHGDFSRIDHFALGSSRVYINPFARYFGSSGIEAFIFQFAQRAAVHRIGKFGTEGSYIEALGASSDLLIRCKGYSDCTVLNFRVINQISHGSHNFGNSRLVVGAE